MKRTRYQVVSWDGEVIAAFSTKKTAYNHSIKMMLSPGLLILYHVETIRIDLNQKSENLLPQ
jgi:hypothetical protein